MLAAGANPDNSDNSPLYMAATTGNVDIARALLAAGTDVNRQSPLSHWSPLYMAAHNSNLGMVTLLLDAGADVDAVTTQRYTPLHSA